MRSLSNLILIFPLLVLFACSEEKPKSTNKVNHLNIVFVIIDDLDFDEVNFYDRRNFPSYTNDYLNGRDSKYRYKEQAFVMPTLDKMAEEAVVFNRFYTPSPVCTPSRFVTLTGKYAHESTYQSDTSSKHINIAFEAYLKPSEDNLAKRLNQLGYTTAFFGKYHNGMNDKPVYLLGNEEPNKNAGYLQRKANYPLFKSYLEDSIGFDVADRLMSEAQSMLNVDWIDEGVGEFINGHAAEPFFLYISLPIPHGYYWPTDRIDTRYTSEGIHEGDYAIKNDFSDAERKNWFNNSSSLGTWLDGSMGNLMSKLKEHNLDENTLIIFTSDHQSRGKMTVYESARVPTFFWMPEMLEPKRIETLGSFLDLAPTLLSFAGETDLQDFKGLDLKPLVAKDIEPNREALFLECGSFRGVVTKKWKYIEKTTHTLEKRFVYDNAKVFPHFKDSIQLYDLQSDFAEQNNLAGEPEYRVIQEDLAEQLNMFLEE